jgi:hypothetical protein
MYICNEIDVYILSIDRSPFTGLPAAVRQPELLAVEPRVSRLRHDGAVAAEHPLDVLEEDVHAQGLPGLALGRLPLRHEDPPVVLVGGGVAAHAGGQLRQEIRHHDAAEGGAVADGDAVRLHHHRLVLLQQGGVAHRAVVVEDGAGEEVGVRRLHDLGAEGRADGAPVGAQEARQRLGHHALGRRHGRHRVAAGLRQLHEGVPGLGDAELGAGHHDRLDGLVKERHGGLQGGLKAKLVAQPARSSLH